MSIVKSQTQRTINRELNELSLLNTYASELLRRVPSTKIQCTSDEGKILVEEDASREDENTFKRTTTHKRSNQQEPIQPPKESRTVSVQSKTSTKVEKQRLVSVRSWVRRKLRFFSRKKSGDGVTYKNVA